MESTISHKKIYMPLPEHRDGLDGEINLVSGATPPRIPLIRLTLEEQEAFEKYLAHMIRLGYIEPSKSPYGSPIFFVKSDGKPPRPVVDYRKLNDITIKDVFPLPLIEELLTCLAKANYHTKFDLKQAFNLLRIRSGDEPLTAFRCHLGTFQYRVMPFGLSNSPSHFQRFITSIFSDMLLKVMIVYVDDLVIFGGKTLEEHQLIVLEVLRRIDDENLGINIGKSLFHEKKIDRFCR